ncbi:unnamed protein product [Fraxinus pennsylvanica]|uniref:Uncharacterized protein n=1 Tax=Fraxinus pennsylvanica TaxID=56036 RepID=A0AAD1Z8W8_9LAMI|nr:unnamed protein product [Fraxinus pennsylvanica]
MVGDDDSKHQDDKETDGGEVSSPASQDHHSHQQHFTEEEEEVEKGEQTSNFVVVEYDDLPEKSYDGAVSGSSSSSSSSSDDESHNFEKNKDTKHNASVDSAKEKDSLSERPAEVIHGALEEQAGDSIVQTCPVVHLEKVSLLKAVSNSFGSSWIRGEFQERLKAVLKEVEEAEGKPMLARGQLRCIGSTTLEEYRKYVEKDAAFERCFQQGFLLERKPENAAAITLSDAKRPVIMVELQKLVSEWPLEILKHQKEESRKASAAALKKDIPAMINALSSLGLDVNVNKENLTGK